MRAFKHFFLYFVTLDLHVGHKHLQITNPFMIESFHQLFFIICLSVCSALSLFPCVGLGDQNHRHHYLLTSKLDQVSFKPSLSTRLMYRS